MAYTTIDDPSAYFQTALYTGTGSSLSITNDGNSDLQPDLVWIKQRNGQGTDHQIVDSSRGNTKYLSSNSSAGEVTSSDRLTSFNSDGFTLGADASNVVNQSGGYLYVGWQWKCNGGTTSTNSDGDINSTVQVNQDAGFTIVQYSPSDSTQRTIGHGMGSTPDIVWVRNRTKSEDTWFWHGAIGFSGALLNRDTTYNTNPLSTGMQAVGASTFTVGTNPVVNGNYPYIAYCWKEVQGFSKFGKYTGNGSSNGPFVYTGFKPAWIMMKRTDSTSSWVIVDAARNPVNLPDNAMQRLWADLSNAESTNQPVDFFSNGFKYRSTYTGFNTSGATYIYMAFAENPFVTSTGIPTTAR